jgi:hypothetical protein
VRATLPRVRSWISLRQRFPGCSKAIRTGSERGSERGEWALAPQRRNPKPESLPKLAIFERSVAR